MAKKDGQSTMGDKGNEDTSRKRIRRERGSQTDEEETSKSDRDESNSRVNMAATLAEINRKLDLALARIKEIDEIKEKQHQLEKENTDLKESLEFAHKSIKTLTDRVDTQQKELSKLTKGVNGLDQAANLKKECTIRLESHSRRNNLIFYNIHEEQQEFSAKTESFVYTFLEQNLNMEEISEISIERAHRLGKRKEDSEKPRPIIVKFCFHKDKEHILSNARKLAGTKYGISQDFPPEIVDTKRIS